MADEGRVSVRQTLEQLRSGHAMDVLDRVPNTRRRDYRQQVEKLPTMIITSGLGQTLAFLKSKQSGREDDAMSIIYGALQDWLTKGTNHIVWEGSVQEEPDLMRRIRLTTSTTLSQLTIEALSYVNWMKRIARAYVEDGEDEGEQGDE